MPKAAKRASDLSPNPQNPRLVTPEALQALERSMDKYGDLGALVYNRRTGHLIAGHQRLKHVDPTTDVVITERHRTPTRQGTTAIGYLEREGERWPYREVDVDETTELEMTIRANVHAGAFDKDRLAPIVQGLREGGSDLGIIGLDAATIAALLGRGESAPIAEPTLTEVEEDARIAPLARRVIELGRAAARSSVDAVGEGISMENALKCEAAHDAFDAAIWGALRSAAYRVDGVPLPEAKTLSDMTATIHKAFSDFPGSREAMLTYMPTSVPTSHGDRWEAARSAFVARAVSALLSGSPPRSGTMHKMSDEAPFDAKETRKEQLRDAIALAAYKADEAKLMAALALLSGQPTQTQENAE